MKILIKTYNDKAAKEFELQQVVDYFVSSNQRGELEQMKETIDLLTFLVRELIAALPEPKRTEFIEEKLNSSHYESIKVLKEST